MAKYIAFLRAINVGGHTVKMEWLRDLFESLGFARVETFIASGNVIFDTHTTDARSLAARVEKRLLAELGYPIATFIRTPAELVAIADHRSFPPAALEAATTLNIAFLAGPLGAQAKRTLFGLRTDIDDFHVHGREIYWKCMRGQSQSTFSNAVLERVLRCQATWRNVTTVRKLADRFRSETK